MTSQLIPFSFESQSIRVVVLDGQPMFGSRDVALALGYSDPSYAYKTHCKSLILLSSEESSELGWVNPNPRGEYVMPESDVYRLIVKSTKPEAERFEKWVFEEVLPSIRKTGSYSIPTKPMSEEREYLMLAREAYKTAKIFGFVGNMAVLSADTYVRSAAGVSILARMGVTHLVADERGKVYTPTELGQLLNPPVSAKKFNLLLEAAGLQQKELGAWLPSDQADGLFEWSDTGKRHVLGTPVKQLRWFRGVLDQICSSPA